MLNYDNQLKNIICFTSITKTHNLYNKEIDKEYILEKFERYIGFQANYDNIFDFVMKSKDAITLDTVLHYFENIFGKNNMKYVNNIHDYNGNGLHPVLYNSINFEKLLSSSNKRKIYFILNE